MILLGRRAGARDHHKQADDDVVKEARRLRGHLLQVVDTLTTEVALHDQCTAYPHTSNGNGYWDDPARWARCFD